MLVIKIKYEKYGMKVFKQCVLQPLSLLPQHLMVSCTSIQNCFMNGKNKTYTQMCFHKWGDSVPCSLELIKGAVCLWLLPH